jgi:hypothetical protein
MVVAVTVGRRKERPGRRGRKVAADLDLGEGGGKGGGEMGLGCPARVSGFGFVRWVGELGQGGEYGPLDGDHLTVQARSMG